MQETTHDFVLAGKGGIVVNAKNLKAEGLAFVFIANTELR